MIPETKYLIVGAGFFGSVIAERIASVLNEKVVVIDKRDHLGGNAYSYTDSKTGIDIHKYGSHIFHTKNEEVWKYINQFTTFNEYRHRVFTKYRGKTYSMPINLHTICSFFEKDLSPAEATEFVNKIISQSAISDPKNLEEKAISLIGKDLYEAFIRGYTQKQWETPLTELPANIITRLPVRFNFNDRYFNDPHEGIPTDGYGKIFEKILGHKNITTMLNTDFFEIAESIPKTTKIIYTGPIDRYFKYKYGMLGWRTTVFEEQMLDVEDYQGTSVVNYADLEVPYTRIHEFKHFQPEKMGSFKGTVIFKEFSKKANEQDTPYYPINTKEDKEKLAKYVEDSKKESNVVFGGRLGAYAYVDMDQTIAMALNTFNSKILKPLT